MQTQRDAMRRLWQRHSGNRDACVRDYADLECTGDVKRKKGKKKISPKEYASRLYLDGVAKGWITEMPTD